MSPKPDPNKEVDPNDLPPPETAMTEAASSGDDAPNLDDIEVHEPGEDGPADTAGTGDAGSGDERMANVTVPPDAMPFDEWYEEFFVPAHMYPNMLLRTQSLAVAPRAPEGIKAALGMYRTCCRVPMLHFVLCPGPEWMRDLSAIAVYAFFLGKGVAAELADRKAAAERAKPKPGESTTAKTGDAAAEKPADGGGQYDFLKKSQAA